MRIVPHRVDARLSLIGSLLLLQACVFLPRTTQVYDRECQVLVRHMDLEEVQVASINRCANEGCVALVVGASAVTAASILISGTIVVAGNVAYWFERRVQCQAAAPPA